MPDPYTIVEVENPYRWGLRRLPPRELVSDRRLADVIHDGLVLRARYVLPPDWDGPNCCDREWELVSRLPHRLVRFEGRLVPLYEEPIE